MLNFTFNDAKKETINNQAQWVESIWGDYDTFYSDMTPESTCVIPTNCLIPRSKNEWDFSEVGGTSSKSIIEVELLNSGDLVIFDGHNRFKDALSQGKQQVTVLIKHNAII